MEIVDELGHITIENKKYVGYTDNSTTKSGRKMIYVNSITEDNKLEDITDPRELEMVQDVLQQIAG